jgi:hypothetical protein
MLLVRFESCRGHHLNSTNVRACEMRATYPANSAYGIVVILLTGWSTDEYRNALPPNTRGRQS